MTRTLRCSIHTGLIGTGLLLCAWTGHKVMGNEELQAPLNPFGINRSPYGEVFAMAMQGPINTNFHVGMFGKTVEQLEHPEHGDDASHEPQTSEASTPERQSPASLTGKLEALINSMQSGHQQRTNPLPASDALKFHLRRNAEDKLRFAYNLDPSHYANYNTLHFFLVEGITTRPELTSSAAKLAHDTIDYCLARHDDPRPALTAAAASTNMLHLMFAGHRENPPQYTTAQMDQTLDLLDQCIARYHQIALEWDASQAWQRLSPQRFEECQNRISFITNIRNAAAETIQRLKNS